MKEIFLECLSVTESIVSSATRYKRVNNSSSAHMAKDKSEKKDKKKKETKEVSETVEEPNVGEDVDMEDVEVAKVSQGF